MQEAIRFFCFETSSINILLNNNYKSSHALTSVRDLKWNFKIFPGIICNSYFLGKAGLKKIFFIQNKLLNMFAIKQLLFIPSARISKPNTHFITTY